MNGIKAAFLIATGALIGIGGAVTANQGPKSEWQPSCPAGASAGPVVVMPVPGRLAELEVQRYSSPSDLKIWW
jgi:hypothetical protein